MTITTDQLSSIANTKGDVLSTSGDKIGSIGQVYVDDTTGEPSWVTAKTGLFGTSESFVPLQGAKVNGSDVVVNYDKDTVKDAPRMDADGSLSPEEEETLYSYYGLGSGSAATAGYADTDHVGHEHDRDHQHGDYADDHNKASGIVDKVKDKVTGDDDDTSNRHGTVGHDTSGPTTDDAMTLSEERLNVGTQTRESGRARLRKYVVTENVTQTVPVSHEEVRLEREPITDANVDAANAGPDISEEEHEVILHEERPVVDKDVVATERVQLNTETVTDHASVNETVRKEEVDTDLDSDRTAR
jgi:uncharacterized protein (TIGR02271 family)